MSSALCRRQWVLVQAVREGSRTGLREEAESGVRTCPLCLAPLPPLSLALSALLLTDASQGHLVTAAFLALITIYHYSACLLGSLSVSILLAPFF